MRTISLFFTSPWTRVPAPGLVPPWSVVLDLLQLELAVLERSLSLQPLDLPLGRHQNAIGDILVVTVGAYSRRLPAFIAGDGHVSAVVRCSHDLAVVIEVEVIDHMDRPFHRPAGERNVPRAPAEARTPSVTRLLAPGSTGEVVQLFRMHSESSG
jgi:hypothetical protein